MASQYQWNEAGWPGWMKSFAVNGFSIDKLKSEIWTHGADGIVVRVSDETEALAASYFVVNGEWICDIDNYANIFALPSNEHVAVD